MQINAIFEVGVEQIYEAVSGEVVWTPSKKLIGLRIPVQTDHGFRRKLTTDSMGN